jgi:hypothetical protein
MLKDLSNDVPLACPRVFARRQVNEASDSHFAEALDKLDRFEQTEPYLQEKERLFPQLEGQFLLDRDGIVRWANIECAKDGLAGVGKFPTEEELLSAAQTLAK